VYDSPNTSPNCGFGKKLPGSRSQPWPEQGQQRIRVRHGFIPVARSPDESCASDDRSSSPATWDRSDRAPSAAAWPSGQTTPPRLAQTILGGGSPLCDERATDLQSPSNPTVDAIHFPLPNSSGRCGETPRSRADQRAGG